MSVLVAPTWLDRNGTGYTATPWGLIDFSANYIEARWWNEIYFSGGNAVLDLRMYMNTTPAFNGSEASPAPQLVTDCFSPQTMRVPISSFTGYTYVAAWIQNNTSGNHNACYAQIIDDFGLAESLTPAGCCHDPMLDLILAAVRKTY